MLLIFANIQLYIYIYPKISNNYPKKMNENFKFVENNHTKGLIESLKILALEAGDSLSGYVGKVLKKHVASKTKNNLGETRDHIDIQD